MLFDHLMHREVLDDSFAGESAQASSRDTIAQETQP
jgi:hypothetical protein